MGGVKYHEKRGNGDMKKPSNDQNKNTFIRRLPNCITGLRIAGTLCLLGVPMLTPVFFVIYTLTGLTDVLDGWLARKTGTASELGAKLDSIADLTFYAVILLRLMPVLWRRLPVQIWYAVAMVLLLRLASYVVAAVKYRRFASVHTYLNKLTGAAVFAIPYVILLPFGSGACWVFCAIAGIASGEELLIHLCSRTYHTGVKSILELRRGQDA